MSDLQGGLNSARDPGEGEFEPQGGLNSAGPPGVEFCQCSEYLRLTPGAARRCSRCGHRQGKAMEINVVGGIVLAVAVLVMLIVIYNAYMASMP